MSLGGHLREFRNRAVVAGLAILIGTIVGWFLYQPVYDFLIAPITHIKDTRPNAQIDVNFNGIAAPFTMKLKVSFWIGFILASPVWLWEIWAFLAPGLTRKEKRLGRLFIGSAVPLFALGIYLGTLCFSSAVEVLLGATPDHAANLPTASEYFSFVSRFILSFGLAFLLPVFLMAFNTMRILPGRLMLKGWRVAVMAIATFAALMTPSPDVWSMFVMCVPLLVLYFGTVALAIFMDRRRGAKEQQERPDWMDAPDDVATPL